MRSRLSACKFLLIAPALFLLLQVSLALHHHHPYSYHDEQDSFHSVSKSINKKICTIDLNIVLQEQKPRYSPLITAHVHPRKDSSVPVILTYPPQSRAPPTATL